MGGRYMSNINKREKNVELLIIMIIMIVIKIIMIKKVKIINNDSNNIY